MLPALSLGKFEANFCIDLCFATNLCVPVYILWLVIIDENGGIFSDFNTLLEKKVMSETLSKMIGNKTLFRVPTINNKSLII